MMAEKWGNQEKEKSEFRSESREQEEGWGVWGFIF